MEHAVSSTGAARGNNSYIWQETNLGTTRKEWGLFVLSWMILPTGIADCATRIWNFFGQTLFYWWNIRSLHL